MTKKKTLAEVETLFSKHKIKVLGKYVNSQTPLKSQCLLCDNIIFPRLDKLNSSGYRCGYCSGRMNTAKTAEEFVKKIGHIPLEPYRSALSPWKMKCGFCGKTISPKYNSLQQGRIGCKFCGKARGGAKRREVGSVKAIQILREAGYEPLVPYPGSGAPWKSKCMTCDSIISPRFGGIQSGQGGCVKCGIKSRSQARTISQEQAIKVALKKKLQPLEPYRGSNKKWKCKCLKCGKVSNPHYQAIRDGKFGCLWCAKKIVDPAGAKELMMKANLQPLVAYPGSKEGWLCLCKKCNREVTPTYGSIRSGQGGCKWCKTVAAKVDPTIAVQLLLEKQIQPLEPFKASHSKWKSRCLRCEKVINPSYHEIQSGKGGCKYCAPNFVNVNRINQVMKDAGFEPQAKYPGSKTDWKVKHLKCGRTFSVVYANIKKAGACRYCAGRSVIPSEAMALMKTVGLKPLENFPGAKEPWKCRCTVCKKVVFPSYSTTASRGSGCIYCAGRKVDPKDAVAFMKSNNVIPLIPFPGARIAWKSKCKICKNEISPQYSSVRSGQGACRFCADWGIDYSAKGFIYLMTNEDFGAHKLGIGNTNRMKGNRIDEHKKHGWILVKELHFEVTDQAFQVEQKVLSWLRNNKKLPVYLSELEMPQGGYTETVDAEGISLAAIWAKVEELSKVKK